MEFSLILCSGPKYMENRTCRKAPKPQHSRSRPVMMRNQRDEYKDCVQDCSSSIFGFVPQNKKIHSGKVT